MKGGREGGNGPVTSTGLDQLRNVLALPDVHAIAVSEDLGHSKKWNLNWWRQTGAFLGKKDGCTVGNRKPNAVMRKGGRVWPAVAELGAPFAPTICGTWRERGGETGLSRASQGVAFTCRSTALAS